jgi:hypothetical protein
LEFDRDIAKVVGAIWEALLLLEAIGLITGNTLLVHPEVDTEKSEVKPEFRIIFVVI